jgi:acetyltransferase
MEIHKLIGPKNICVYGVSMDPKKLGSVVYQNIVMNGFTGKVFPINPKYTEIFNTTCYPNASSIVGDIDLAVVVTPSQFVNSIMEDVGKKGIPSAIVISAGFSETGKEGKLLEDELKKICTKYNISLLGPNCLGLINTSSKLNASFAEYYPSNGNIAFLIDFNNVRNWIDRSTISK